MANLINRLYELQKLKLACKMLFSDCQVLPPYLKYTAKYKVQKSGFSYIWSSPILSGPLWSRNRLYILIIIVAQNKPHLLPSKQKDKTLLRKSTQKT